MRVAVSGTHCCGKSTLIDEFLLAHPEYEHEPEPYVVLVEEYDAIFGAQPSTDDFCKQLEFMVTRLQDYRAGDRVIFERSPIDFIGYMLALEDLGRERTARKLVEQCLPIVRDALQRVDLIVFLPVGDDASVDKSEDPALRESVNERLVGIYREGDLDLLTSIRPIVLEASGSTPQRLRTLESAVADVRN